MFGSRSYGKRVGGHWDVYPEQLHEKWYEYWEANRVKETVPTPPDDWQGLLTSFRFGSRVPFPRPALTKDQKDKIIEAAMSREDFHDVDKIIAKPGYGTCLCELRFVTGARCLKYLTKGSNGETLPEGKKHWAWYIDINPRAFLCPYVKRNGLEAEGNSERFHCDILIKEPTEGWALSQDPSDPEGSLAGRVTSDEILPGNCPQCDLEFRVDPVTKQLHNPDFSNPLIRPDRAKRQPCTEPPDFITWDEPGYPQPPPWDRDLSIRPLVFSPEENDRGAPLRTYHPLFIKGWSYHLRSFADAMGLYDEKDLVYDESRITMAVRREKEMETAQVRMEATQEQDRLASEMVAHEEKVMNMVDQLVQEDYIEGRLLF
ncbi:hypothetical protein PSPO01_15488 [Paraphaeosphaeria sporulosa]